MYKKIPLTTEQIAGMLRNLRNSGHMSAFRDNSFVPRVFMHLVCTFGYSAHDAEEALLLTVKKDFVSGLHDIEEAITATRILWEGYEKGLYKHYEGSWNSRWDDGLKWMMMAAARHNIDRAIALVIGGAIDAFCRDPDHFGAMPDRPVDLMEAYLIQYQ